jgi:uncharacterized membrane protein YtjA (UPF0391 family)
MSLLWWTLIAFLVATVGGVLGFTNVASGASKVGQVLFGTFALITVVIVLLVIQRWVRTPISRKWLVSQGF